MCCLWFLSLSRRFLRFLYVVCESVIHSFLLPVVFHYTDRPRMLLKGPQLLLDSYKPQGGGGAGQNKILRRGYINIIWAYWTLDFKLTRANMLIPLGLEYTWVPICRELFLKIFISPWKFAKRRWWQVTAGRPLCKWTQCWPLRTLQILWPTWLTRTLLTSEARLDWMVSESENSQPRVQCTLWAIG